MFRFWLVPFGATFILTAIIGRPYNRPVDTFQAWLLAITIVTFLTYGYDKAIAGSGRKRVPENVLLTLTLFGGDVGAFLGRWLFRHKTVKKSFRVKFWLVIILQIIFIAIYYIRRM